MVSPGQNKLICQSQTEVIKEVLLNDYPRALYIFAPCVVSSLAMVLNTESGLILGLRPANERWRYFATSLIGWAQT